MGKFVISVLGFDRPGIIALIAKVLFEKDCNIENVSQTILQSEFSGAFIVWAPETLLRDDLENALIEKLSPLDMHVFVKKITTMIPNDDAAKRWCDDCKSKKIEPFVVTTIGPDRKGLVASITEVIARHHANVTNLHAVFKGGDDPNRNFMIYEVDVPMGQETQVFFDDLRKKARELELDISIQHKNIFKEINRI